MDGVGGNKLPGATDVVYTSPLDERVLLSRPVYKPEILIIIPRSVYIKSVKNGTPRTSNVPAGFYWKTLDTIIQYSTAIKR